MAQRRHTAAPCRRLILQAPVSGNSQCVSTDSPNSDTRHCGTPPLTPSFESHATVSICPCTTNLTCNLRMIRLVRFRVIGAATPYCCPLPQTHSPGICLWKLKVCLCGGERLRENRGCTDDNRNVGIVFPRREREREMIACYVGFVIAWRRNNHASTTVRVRRTVFPRNDVAILLVRPYVARGSVLS